MDREHAGQDVEGGGYALPSRSAAIAALRDALHGEPGPILLTGEAGAGKTWLWGRLAADRADRLRWLAVDLAPTTDPADVFRALGHALGLAEPDHARRPLADFLAEQAEEGRRWALVVDEAHNASADVLEELRLLSNRLGRPGGFATLVLSAQTRLARRLATAPLAALEARVSSRIHLRPIDADEARDLLARLRPGRPWSIAEVEELHREAGGNPRRLLRLAASSRPRPASSPARPLPEVAPRAIAPPPVPRLGSDRPPLRVEEGLIEVGWDGPDTEGAPSPAPVAAPRSLVMVEPGPEPEREVEAESDLLTGEDEPIHDHYAALQAWNEWARNQGRQPAAAARASVAEDEGESPRDSPARVEAHEAQDFAPYSQLFSRLKQAADG